jgi:hypothetical protein
MALVRKFLNIGVKNAFEAIKSSAKPFGYKLEVTGYTPLKPLI